MATKSFSQFVLMSYLQYWLVQQEHDRRNVVKLWLDHRRPNALNKANKVQIADALEALIENGIVEDYAIFPASFWIEKSQMLRSLQ